MNNVSRLLFLILSGGALLAFAPPARCEPADVIYNPAFERTEIYAEPATVIAADAVTSPGRQAVLLARVERRDKKVFKAVRGVTVEFAVDGSTVGQSETDGAGLARVPLLPEAAGEFLISARLLDTDLYRAATGYGLLAVLPSTLPILAVDFDSALYRGISGKFDLSGVERLRPVSGADQALRSLSQDFVLLYFTESSPADLPKIRKWIHHWKMPKVPVAFWDETGKALKDANWKSDQLAKLMNGGRNIRAGVGGTSDVMRAFRSRRLPCVAVRTSALQEPGASEDWTAAEKELRKKIARP